MKRTSPTNLETAPGDLLQVVERIRTWLLPIIIGIQQNNAVLHTRWTPGTGWSEY